MQKIVVLTYDTSHRKTYDLLCLLKIKGYNDVVVYARKMTYTKKNMPFIEHRPQRVYASTKDICKAFKYNYCIIEEYEQIKENRNSIFLVAGAGLLPNEFVQNYRIINGHPGYIPNCRGLDAYKWAIEEDEIIGVSTHLLGDDIDAGIVLERRKFDIKLSDTFHSVAYAIYENEIEMMVNAIEKVMNNEEECEYVKPKTVIHKRMPYELEVQLIDKFERHKKRG